MVTYSYEYELLYWCEINDLTQTLSGRIIRKEGDKVALLFSLVFENTVDDQWYTNANNGADVVFIDEAEVFKMLSGEDYKCRKSIVKPVFTKY